MRVACRLGRKPGLRDVYVSLRSKVAFCMEVSRGGVGEHWICNSGFQGERRLQVL